MSEQAGLAGTLRLAITQCRQQDEALLARDGEIRSMKEDNARLQARVSELETANRSLRLEQDHEWAQALLQRHVEAQAEIAYLKRKLKAYKEMLHQDLPTPVPTSTPLMNVAAPTAAPTDGATKRKHSAGLSPSATHLTRPAKHSRTEIHEGISVKGTDLTDERAQLCGKTPNITILTEDGEDYAVRGTAGATSDRSSVSSFRRLAGLLEQPQSDKISLRKSYFSTAASVETRAGPSNDRAHLTSSAAGPSPTEEDTAVPHSDLTHAHPFDADGRTSLGTLAKTASSLAN